MFCMDYSIKTYRIIAPPQSFWQAIKPIFQVPLLSRTIVRTRRCPNLLVALMLWMGVPS
jgi:hypothetical protein